MSQKKYDAFLSYSHADNIEAEKLIKFLESYNIPKNLRKQIDHKHFRIFMDKNEMAYSGSLPEAISQALRESEYLIVICSPNAVKSDWVNPEIEEFLKINPQSYEKIFPIIIDGIPDSKNKNDPQEAFPQSLQDLSINKNNTLFAANIKDCDDKKTFFEPTCREKEYLRIVALLLKVEYALINDRFKRVKVRNRWIKIATILAIVLLTIGLAIEWQTVQHEKEVKSSFLSQKAEIAFRQHNCNQANALYEEAFNNYSSLKNYLGFLSSKECLIPHKKTNNEIINFTNEFLLRNDNKHLLYNNKNFALYDNNLSSISDFKDKKTQKINNICQINDMQFLLSIETTDSYNDKKLFLCTEKHQCKAIDTLNNFENIKIQQIDAKNYIFLAKETIYGHSVILKYNLEKKSILKQVDLFPQSNYVDFVIDKKQNILITIAGKKLILWDLKTLKKQKEISLFAIGFQNLMLFNNKIFFTYQNDIFYLDKNLILAKIATKHTSDIFKLKSYKNQYLFSLDTHGILNIWNKDLQQIAQLNLKKDSRFFIFDSNKLLVQDSNKSAKIYNLKELFKKRNLKHIFRKTPYYCSKTAKYYFEQNSFLNRENNISFVLSNNYILNKVSFSEKNHVALISGWAKSNYGNFRGDRVFSYLVDLKNKNIINNIGKSIQKYVHNLTYHFMVTLQALHPYKNIIALFDDNNIYLVYNQVNKSVIYKIYTQFQNQKVQDIMFDQSGKFLLVLLENEIGIYSLNKKEFIYLIKLKNQKLVLHTNQNKMTTLFQFSSMKKNIYMKNLIQNTQDKIVVQYNLGLLVIDIKNKHTKLYPLQIPQQKIHKTLFFKHYVVLKYKFFKEEFYLYDLKSFKETSEFRWFVKNAIDVQLNKNDNLEIINYHNPPIVLDIKDMR